MKRSTCYVIITFLSLALLCMVVVLAFPKRYCTLYLMGNYQSEEQEALYLTFFDDGRYCRYTSRELYESGTYIYTDRPGIFQLSPYGLEETHDVLAYRDGTLYLAWDGALDTYVQTSNRPWIPAEWSIKEAFPDLNYS